MTKDITIGRLILQFGWAENGTWEVTNTDGMKHVYLISCHIVKYEEFRSLFFILGPLYIAIAYGRKM